MNKSTQQEKTLTETPVAPSLRSTDHAARSRCDSFHTLSIKLYQCPPLIPLLRVSWNGTPSRAYFIESRSGLETSAPPWSALARVTNAAVPAQWSLPATHLPGQFLRLRLVQ